MSIFSVLSHFHRIEDVVSAINSDSAVEYFGGTFTGQAESLAGAWAFKAAKDEQSDEITPDELEAYLEILEDAGASFDRHAALERALCYEGASYLKQVREDLNLTQEQLAKKLGWSAQQVSNIESANRPLQTQTRLALHWLQLANERAL